MSRPQARSIFSSHREALFLLTFEKSPSELPGHVSCKIYYIIHQVNILPIPSLVNPLLFSPSKLPPVYGKVDDAMMKIMDQGLSEITQRKKNKDF